jgi:hypothetical protein
VSEIDSDAKAKRGQWPDCITTFEELRANPPPCLSFLGDLEPKQLVDNLYFGTEIPGGGNVTGEDWRSFCDKSITPRFPEGLTVLEGYGQWQGKAGRTTKESAYLVQIIHSNTPETNAAIKEVIQIYLKRFSQESVAQVRIVSEVEFHRLDDNQSPNSTSPGSNPGKGFESFDTPAQSFVTQVRRVTL